MRFKRLTDEPIEIEFIPDEHDEAKDFVPSFWFNNKRYYLDDFVRLHNNYIFDYAEFPDWIHAIEANSYWKPLFIQLIDGDSVIVYEEIE